MAIGAGFDVHRAQIAFDALDTETGEVKRGRTDATPAAVDRWAQRFAGRRIDVAVEACTGWLFVSDALVAAGAVPHLAEPVETARAAGSQAGVRRPTAKTRSGRGSCSRRVGCRRRGFPPEHVRQWRSRARMRHTLVDERTQWMQAHPGDPVSPRHRRDARENSAPAPAVSSSTASTFRPTRASGSRSRSPWSTRSTRGSRRSSGSRGNSRAANPAAGR